MKMEISVVERHCSILKKWIADGIKNAILIHIDEHSDAKALTKFEICNLFSQEKQLSKHERDTTFFSKNGFFDLENYVQVALKLGIISKVYWIRPDFASPNLQCIKFIKKAFLETGLGITIQDWQSLHTINNSIHMTINGINWEFTNINSIQINTNSEYLLDIDADYFRLEKNDHFAVLRFLLSIGRLPQIKMINFSWSRQGGFVSRELYNNLFCILKELVNKNKFIITPIKEETFPVDEYNLSFEEKELYYDALYLLRNRHFKDTINIMEGLLNKFPTNPGFLYVTGLALRKMNEFNSAESNWKAAIINAPWCHTIINDLATLLLETERYKESLDYLKFAEKVYPYSKEITYNLGHVSYALGDYENAIDYFGKTLKYQPIYFKAAYMKGLALKNVGKFIDAKVILEEILPLVDSDTFQHLVKKTLKELKY
jgi:tetratricopeptide (TPR) repeat protein